MYALSVCRVCAWAGISDLSRNWARFVQNETKLDSSSSSILKTFLRKVPIFVPFGGNLAQFLTKCDIRVLDKESIVEDICSHVLMSVIADIGH